MEKEVEVMPREIKKKLKKLLNKLGKLSAKALRKAPEL